MKVQSILRIGLSTILVALIRVGTKHESMEAAMRQLQLGGDETAIGIVGTAAAERRLRTQSTPRP
jgi:hypothetical protein